MMVVMLIVIHLDDYRSVVFLARLRYKRRLLRYRRLIMIVLMDEAERKAKVYATRKGTLHDHDSE